MFNTITLQADPSSNQCASYFSTSEAEGIQIEFPDSGNPRSRKVVKRSNARKTGKIPSWKMNRMVQWESENELVVFRILDGDATVKAFFEQPFKVRYVEDSDARHHFPDVLIEFLDGIEVWEIKDSQSADCPEIKKRTELLVPLFAEFEIRYRVVYVDKKSQQGTEAYSLSMLKFGRFPISQVERESARCVFKQQKMVSWGFIMRGGLGERGRNIVGRLLLEGELTAKDQSQALLPATKIIASSDTQSLVAEWRN